MGSNLQDRAISVAKILLLAFLAVAPFFINPFHFTGVRATETLHQSGFTMVISHIGTPSEFLWIWPRVLLVSVVGLIGLLLLPAGKRLHRTAFTFSMLVYLVVVYISTLLAHDDWSFKILGGVGRLDGLFYQTGLVMFGIFAYDLIKLSKDKNKLIHAALSILAISGGLEAAILIMQRIGIDLVALIHGGYYWTPVGTIGHPGMVAGFLIISIFSALWLSENTASPLTKILTYVLVALVSVGIGISANKSSTFAILTVLILLLLVRRDGKTLLALALFSLGVFIITPYIPNYIEFNRNLVDTRTGKTRLLIWKMAVEAIAKTPGQPLIGAGPDGFLITLGTKIPIRELLQEYRIEYDWPKDAKIIDIKLLFTEKDPLRSRAFMVTLENYPTPGKTHRIIYRYYLDKAHNLFLDRAVSYGILAAAIWLYLFLFPIFKLYRRKDAASLYLAGGVLALFIYYLAWFPVPQTEPLYLTWLVIAWVWVEALARNEKNNGLSSAR